MLIKISEKKTDNNEEMVSAWDRVKKSRDINRFKTIDIIEQIFDSFTEMHGDRYTGDDKAMVCGLAFFKNTPVTVIGQEKGNDLDTMKFRNYGMNNPEGYRKSLRLMKQAEKFNRPIICIIDTPGAYPGIEAEEHGQAEAIARNLQGMVNLRVPVISIFIGEGGSGGALALGVANKVIILENACFSVVSPEGCSSILWKDTKKADIAADFLKMTAHELKVMEIVDEVISEEGAFEDICNNISISISDALEEYKSMTQEEIIRQRKIRFRDFDKKFIDLQEKQIVSAIDLRIEA